MKTLVILLALFQPALAVETADEAAVRRLIERLAADDSKAFSTEYFRHTFNKWNQRVNVRSFRLDSMSVSSAGKELVLSNDRLDMKVVLAISGDTQTQVFEARRLLIPDRSAFSSHDRLVLDFVEQFAWLYDSGDDSILLDFLYPKHIRLSYRDDTRTEIILEMLRQRFSDFIEISNISWAGKGAIFEIKLTLDSPLQPLIIEVDLVKYSTARFFEHEDQDGRIAAFADSIRMWFHPQTNLSEQNGYFVASSKTGSISQYLRECMAAKEYRVLKEDVNSAEVEITLPEMEGLPSHVLLIALKPRTWTDGHYAIVAESRNTVGGQTGDEELQMQHRFLALNAPASVEEDSQSGGKMAGRVIVHSNENHTIEMKKLMDYDSLLRNVSKDKYTYFVPHRSGRTPDGAKLISGYVVWKDRSRLWHHIAKIEEVFIRGELFTVQVDFYPFIRSDNVLNLLSEPDESTKLKNIGIKIR